MATTRFLLLPNSAEFPSTNFPSLETIHSTRRRPVLGFDTTTAETCYWTIHGVQGLTGTMTAVISYVMASATTGSVAFDVAVEAIATGDVTTNLSSATSFDTVNGVTDPAVPTTAGFMEQISITLTNDDSLAAANYGVISLARDVAADSAAGDAYVLSVEIRDAA